MQNESQIRLIDAREAAGRLGLSIWTVYAWAAGATFPAFCLERAASSP